MIITNELGTPQLNTVHHCRAEALLSALDSNSIDLGVCSPPYDDLRKYHGFAWNFEYIAQQTYRVLKPGGVLVWVVGDSFVEGSETLTSFEQALYFKKSAGFNMHQRFIWEKQGMPHKRPQAYLSDFEDVFVLSKGLPKTFNPIMKRNAKPGVKQKKWRSNTDGSESDPGWRVSPEYSILSNVWLINVGGNNVTLDDVDHPAMFPEALAERHILTWSNPGDVVLYYFGGSGTTAKMARKNGRRWLTCDLSREYCDLMERRLAQPYTPMFAEMLGA